MSYCAPVFVRRACLRVFARITVANAWIEMMLEQKISIYSLYVLVYRANGAFECLITLVSITPYLDHRVSIRRSIISLTKVLLLEGRKREIVSILGT